MSQGLVVWTVAFAVATLFAGLGNAWQAGRLGRLIYLPDGRRSEVGLAMTLTLYFGAAGVGWTYFAGLVALYSLHDPGLVGWAHSATVGGGWWMPALILGFEGVGALMTTHYTNAVRAVPAMDWYGSSDARDPDIDPRAIALLVLALIALSLALLTVWLVARARAQRDGIDLGLMMAFGFR